MIKELSSNEVEEKKPEMSETEKRRAEVERKLKELKESQELAELEAQLKEAELKATVLGDFKCNLSNESLKDGILRVVNGELIKKSDCFVVRHRKLKEGGVNERVQPWTQFYTSEEYDHQSTMFKQASLSAELLHNPRKEAING